MGRSYNKPEWLTANAASCRFGTIRSWLRDNADAGRIRRRVIAGYAEDGTPRVRYLYNAADIERVMESGEYFTEEVDK